MLLLVAAEKRGLCDHLRQLLIGEGYEVITTASGEEAINALEDLSPDVMITDILGPDTGGVSLLRHVQERDPHCPVIVTVAHGSRESAVEALRLGAYDFVIEPFDPEVILTVVRRAVDFRRLQQAVSEAQQALTAQVLEMSVLYETALDLVSSLSLSEVLESLLSRAIALLHAKGGNVWLYDKHQKQLAIAAGRGPWVDLTGCALALGEGLAGKVAQSGCALRVDDYSNWEGRSPQYEDLGYANLIGVPLMVQDRLVGVLNIADDTFRGGFSEADEALLLQLAPLAALAIERVRLYSQTETQFFDVRRTHQEISALQELTSAIQSSLSLPDVLNRIAEGVVYGLGYKAAMVAVYEPQRDALVVQSAVLDREVWSKGEALTGMDLIGAFLTMDREENLAIRAARQGEVAFTHKLSDLFRPTVSEEMAQVLQQMAGVQTLVTVPLMANGQLVGNFFAGSSRDSISEANTASLKAFARQAALAIEHARLFEQESERRRLADMLHGVSTIIGSTLELDELQALILEQATRVFSCDSCGLFFLKDSRPDLVAGRCSSRPSEVTVEGLRETPEELLEALSSSQQAIVLPDVPAEMQWPSTEAIKVRSWIGAPLFVRDQVLGLLTLNSYTANAYHEGDKQLAMEFAKQAAAAIANARIYSEVKRNWREQEYLQEIAQAFNSTLDLQQVLTLVMTKTNELLGVEAGSVALLSEDRQELTFHASAGGGADVVRGFKMPANEGIVGWVIFHGKSLLVPDVTRDARHYGRIDAESGFKTRSILCVPLISKGKVLGAIEVLNKRDGLFDDDDLRMTEALALSAAPAIENAMLFEREKQAREELAQAQDELVRAQRLAVLGQIGVTVRHEVNNPLTVVLGNADWLLQETPDLEDEQRRALKAIRANAIRIRDIVHKLEGIKSDRVTEYVRGIEMIDLHNQDITEESEGDAD